MIIVDRVENGPVLIYPNIYKDDRGYFYESFNDKEFREKVCDTTFVQDNQSCSSRGVIRGMHFQKGEFAQAKLVRVVRGAVVDVVVDIRKDSKNYGKYYEYLLTEENHYQLFIPRGFAHGFLSLRDDTIFQYKCDNVYNKESEGSFRYDSFGFKWEKYLNSTEFRISTKDTEAPTSATPMLGVNVVEIPIDSVRAKVQEAAIHDDYMRVTNSTSPNLNAPLLFENEFYADINEGDKIVQVKIEALGPYIYDLQRITPIRRVIGIRADDGKEIALSPTFEEVIRFYKYK